MAALLTLIRRYPLPTACGFAATRGFCGDAMAQALEHDPAAGPFDLDLGRSAIYVTWGCCSALLYDYTFYSRLFPRWFPTYVNGQFSKMNVAKAVGFDALILTPVAYFPVFYILKDCIIDRTRSPGGACGHYFMQDFVPQNAYSLAFWTPVNVVMFGVVRPEYRVGFTSVMALGYCVVLSWVTAELAQQETNKKGVALSPEARRDSRLRRRVSKVI